MDSRKIAKIIKTVEERCKFFTVNISRYNAAGGDMWHIWIERTNAQNNIVATDLNIQKALNKICKKLHIKS